MITAIKYLESKNCSKKDVKELKLHAKNFLFFKYEIMKEWNEYMAKYFHQLYCEVYFGKNKR